MKEITFMIERRAILAVQEFASRDRSRDVLRYTMFELGLEKQVCNLITTDGRCLGAVSIPIVTGKAEPVQGADKVLRFSLLCDGARALPKSKGDPLVSLQYADGATQPKAASIKICGMAIDLPVSDATSPNWRSVVPGQVAEVPIKWNFSLDLLWKFHRAAKALRPRHAPIIRIMPSDPTGLDAISVFIEAVPEFYGAFMPARSPCMCSIPDWCKQV
jgi:hypothetical protein